MDYRKVILGLLVVSGISCNTEDITPARLFVREIEDPSCYKDQFDYKDGHLVEFRRLFGQQIETITQFYYLGDQLIKVHIKREQGLEHVIELTYAENGLRLEEKATTIQQGDTTSIGKRKFTYQQGLLKSIMRSVNDSNFRPMETVFHWSDGNIIQTDLYYFLEGERRFNGNRMFTYDHGVNYSNQDMAFLYTEGIGAEIKMSRNNLVTMQENTGVNTYQGGYYTFTYNKSGYPMGYVYKVGEVEFTPIKILYW
jgi:hypothetical protein